MSSLNLSGSLLWYLVVVASTCLPQQASALTVYTINSNASPLMEQLFNLDYVAGEDYVIDLTLPSYSGGCGQILESFSLNYNQAASISINGAPGGTLIDCENEALSFGLFSCAYSSFDGPCTATLRRLTFENIFATTIGNNGVLLAAYGSPSEPEFFLNSMVTLEDVHVNNVDISVVPPVSQTSAFLISSTDFATVTAINCTFSNIITEQGLFNAFRGLIQLEGIIATDLYSLIGAFLSSYQDSIIIGSNVVVQRATVESYGAIMYTWRTSINFNNSVFTDGTNLDIGGFGSIYHDGPGTNVSYVNCMFLRHSAGNGAVAVVAFGPTSSFFDGCTFAHNVAREHGGVMWIETVTTTTITNSVFLNNSVTVYAGGCLYIQRTSEVYLSDCTFTDNTANYGSAICIDECNEPIAITQCTFENNFSLQQGSVFIEETNTVVLDFITVTNSTSHEGAFLVGYFSDTSVLNAVFTNTSTFGGGDGGVILGRSATFTINNTLALNPYSAFDGGFLSSTDSGYISVNAVYVHNLTCINCKSYYDGAVMWGATTSLFVISELHVEGTSAAEGGALVATDAVGLFVTHSSFKNCHAAAVGGVVKANNVNFVLNDTLIQDSDSGTIGGGLYVTFNSNDFNVQIHRCTFERLMSDDGACFHGSGGSALFSFSSFSECQAARGGGAAVFEQMSAEVNDCDFSENVAVQDGGGAVYANGAVSAFRRCDFSTNEAGASGGAVLIYQGQTLFADCSFSDNSASGGAALYAVVQVSATVVNTDFITNQAVLSGAAIYCENHCSLSVVGGEFVQNTVTASPSGIGGAVSVASHSRVSIVYASFVLNAAALGGAIGAQIINVTVDVAHSYFSYNSATGSGGSLYMYTESPFLSSVSIADTSIQFSNAAVNGGAVFIYGGPLVVERTAMSSCNSNRGGAIAATTFTAVSVSQSTFSQCSSIETGGGLMMTDGNVTLTESTFFSCSSNDGGAMTGYGLSWTLADVVFASNSANTGVHISQETLIGGSSLQFTDCVFFGGESSGGSDEALLLLRSSTVSMTDTVIINSGMDVIRLSDSNVVMFVDNLSQKCSRGSIVACNGYDLSPLSMFTEVSACESTPASVSSDEMFVGCSFGSSYTFPIGVCSDYNCSAPFVTTSLTFTSSSSSSSSSSSASASTTPAATSSLNTTSSSTVADGDAVIDESQDSNLPPSTIILIIAISGGSCVLCVCGGVAVWLLRRRAAKKEEAPPNTRPEEGLPVGGQVTAVIVNKRASGVEEAVRRPSKTPSNPPPISPRYSGTGPRRATVEESGSGFTTAVVSRNNSMTTSIVGGQRAEGMASGFSSIGSLESGTASFVGMSDAVVMGRGGQATVYSAFNFSLGYKVCLKVFNTAADFERESFVLSNVPSHPNIVSTISVPNAPPLTLVMRLAAHGNLSDYMSSHPSIPRQSKLSLAHDIASGLAFLHSVAVCHLDMKPANVLLSNGRLGDLQGIITDFGASFVQGRSDLRVSMCTVKYAAPEVLAMIEGKSIEESGLMSYTSLDVYSFGVTLWELFTNQSPHGESPPKAIIAAAAKSAENFRVAASLVPDPDVRDIVERCTRPASSRPDDLSDILPWLATLRDGQ